MVEPRILLLDEPLSNLDAHLREEMRFEIRRLHEVGITSVYVTHDQAEAMVAADRIAVMHDGHLEQVGAPEEIYEQPGTPFMAGFIGRTNSLDGAVVERVFCSGLTLSTTANSRVLPPGARVALSIRPQAIGLQATEGGHAPDANVPDCRVVRHVYPRDARDYLVAVIGSELTLRVATSSRQAFKAGEAVRLTIEPDACRVIPA